MLDFATSRNYQKQIFTGIMNLIIERQLTEIIDWYIENLDNKLLVVDTS